MEAVVTRQAGLPEGWAVFALTTRDRPERQAHLRRELARSGFGGQVLISQRPTDAGGFRSIGSRGCTAGHLACLRVAHEAGVEVCIVAEDDVLVAPRASRLVRAVAEELAGREWATLYLGHLGNSPVRSQPLHRLTPHVFRCEGWEVLGAHLVAVHRRALPALIEDFHRRFLPGGHRIDADGVHNEFRRDQALDTLVCLPNLAIQAPSPSGVTVGSNLRTRALHIDRVRRAVEVEKRAVFALGSLVPPRLTMAMWNRRAHRPAEAAPAAA